MINDTAGIILAGGKNTRMGLDKAFISFSGRPLIEFLIETLSDIFKILIIVTNKPHLYQKYDIQICSDIIKDKGPLGGIHAALSVSKSMYNFVVACDMPLINRDLIKYIIGKSNGYDAVLAEYGERLHPLCAVYSRNCIMPIKLQIDKKNLKMVDFLKFVNTKIILQEEIKKIDPEGRSFINVNTKDDYECLVQKFPAK